jgi:threonine dehydratase
VVASTGNFGQAVAYAGRAAGVPVTVYAGTDGNPRKLGRIARFGADVRQQGHDFDAAREHAAAFAAESGQTLLVDGEDPWIAIGAGTVAAEVTASVEREELPPLAAAYIPVGNGALIAGVGAWLRHASPATEVIGVQSDAAPSMTLSWREGRLIETETANTRAGGIATRVPVPEALAMMAGVVDDMVLVSEAALADAQTVLREVLGITVELAAAASWAGFIARPPAGEGAALIVVTGSNAEA